MKKAFMIFAIFSVVAGIIGGLFAFTKRSR